MSPSFVLVVKLKVYTLQIHRTVDGILIIIINPWHTCSKGCLYMEHLLGLACECRCYINGRYLTFVGTCLVCVCLSVTTYSLTTHGFGPNKAYQKIQHDVETKKVIFVKRFVQKLWHNLLTSSSSGVVVLFFPTK